jgi:hypothetical protein
MDILSNNIIKKINYLHFGDGLNNLINLIDDFIETNSKTELAKTLLENYHISDYATDIIKSYGNEYQDYIDVQSLRIDLIKTLRTKSLFEDLNCRGFSYLVSDDFDFSYKLDKSINFKFALLTDKFLYYPPRIRRYLPRPHQNHIRIKKYPSIAFALGRIIDRNLYIITLQSDLFFTNPSYIREHIKGWRRVIFNEIIQHMKNKVKNIYLITTEDIVFTYKSFLSKYQQSPPAIWDKIYDNTAYQFGMKLVTFDYNINLQTVHGSPEINTNKMYHLKIKT